MTKKTWIRWEVACACLLIGCGGSSARQNRSAYQAQPQQQPEQSQAAATAEPAERPAASAAATDGPVPSDAQPTTETKISAPVDSNTEVVQAKADVEVEKAGGAPVVGTAGEQRAEANLTLVGTQQSIGSVTFAQSGNTVTIIGRFAGLKPGMHALHIHEKGDCGGKDAKNAGKHFNPTGAKHGPPESGQRHAGDFGNLTVDKDGNATFEMTTDSITVQPGADSIVGRAVVIHAKKDDGKTQPSGNAGGGIACGVIQAREGEAK